MAEIPGENPTLLELIDEARGLPPEVRGLIQEQARRTPHSFEHEPFAENWQIFFNMGDERAVDEVKHFLKERLLDQILVDLGGGHETSTMRCLAKELAAKGYVNVDTFFEGTSSLIKPAREYRGNEYEVEGIGVKADMLDFVAHMYDDAANFALNGIDGSIILECEYDEALAKELVRATKSKGLIFGVNSGALFNLDRLVKQGKIENVKKCTLPLPERYFVFEKS